MSEYYELLPESVKFARGYPYKTGKIELFDNAFIGAKSIIMYEVIVGPNAIVAAESAVTKYVLEGTVVGNPARVIGSVEKVAAKRAELVKRAHISF